MIARIPLSSRARTRAERPLRRPRRGVAALLIAGLVGGLGFTALAAPAVAAPASVDLGPVTARVADHVGGINQDGSGSGGSGPDTDYCIRYAPKDGSNARTTWGSGESITAHGRDGSKCPPNLDTREQSALSVDPVNSLSAVVPGEYFKLGTVKHYNNPIQTSGRTDFYRGTFSFQLLGQQLDFPWWLYETPNTPGDVDDEFKFTSQASDTDLQIGGTTYRLAIFGFAECDGKAPSNPKNSWKTKERKTTTSCLWASLVEKHQLAVTKLVDGTAGADESFKFTAESSLDGSPWSQKFSLKHGESQTATLVGGESVTVTEKLGADWKTPSVRCTDESNAELVATTGKTFTVDADGAVGDIECIVTNTQIAEGTLKLAKQVEGAGYVPSGDGAKDFLVSVTCGTEVQQVALADGADWTHVTVPANVDCTVEEQAPGAELLVPTTHALVWGGPSYQVDHGDRTAETPTVRVKPNKHAKVKVFNTIVVGSSLYGSLSATKAIEGDGYTGTGPEFPVSWQCAIDGEVVVGPYTDLLTAGETTLLGDRIPVGSDCTVTETAPLPELATSFVWGPLPEPQTARVDESNLEAGVVITNTISREYDLAIVKNAETGELQAVEPGDAFEYVLDVRNVLGGAVDEVITITDELPAQLTLTDGAAITTDAGWTADVAGNIITVTGTQTGAVEVGAVITTVRIPVTVLATDPAPIGSEPVDFADILNVATVDVPGDIDPSNNRDDATVPLKQLEANASVQCENDVPWVHFTLETANAPLPENVDVTWTAASGATVTKTVPVADGKVLWPYGEVDENGVSIAWPGWRPVQEGDVVGQGTIVDAWEDMVKDSSLPSYEFADQENPIAITFHVNPSQTVLATYPQATPACAVVRDASVGIVKTASAPSVKSGGELSYTLRVSNSGLGAASPVTLIDEIPAKLKVTSIETAEAPVYPRWENCAVDGADEQGFGGVLQCELNGPLGRAATAPDVVLHVTVDTIVSSLTVTNTGEVCWNDIDAADPAAVVCAESSVVVAIGAPLAETGGNPPATDEPGDPLANTGGGLASTGFAGGAWIWLAVALIVLGGGATAFVLIRRRKPDGTAEGDGPEQA